ncbi:hypothetical protein BKA80DRAFT_279993 [Phyllosticta citrichinensis]
MGGERVLEETAGAGCTVRTATEKTTTRRRRSEHMAHACRAPEEQGRRSAGLVEITRTKTTWTGSHRCHGAGTGADPAHQESRRRSADPWKEKINGKTGWSGWSGSDLMQRPPMQATAVPNEDVSGWAKTQTGRRARRQQPDAMRCDGMRWDGQ